MAKGPTASASSPITATPPSSALKRSTSNTQNMKNQRSILGFFQKSSPSTPSGARNAEPASSPAQRASEQQRAGATAKATLKDNKDKDKDKDQKKGMARFSQKLTPIASSDLVGPEEDDVVDTKASFSYWGGIGLQFCRISGL